MPSFTLPAASFRRYFPLLGLALGLSGGLLSCQSAGGEVPARSIPSVQATAADSAATVAATPAVPDSLALTPLLPLENVPTELHAAVAELHRSSGRRRPPCGPRCWSGPAWAT